MTLTFLSRISSRIDMSIDAVNAEIQTGCDCLEGTESTAFDVQVGNTIVLLPDSSQTVVLTRSKRL